MMAIVETTHGITLLGAGLTPPGALEAALAKAPVLVAADGGAGVALDHGKTPQAVIGDFDSLDADTRAALPAASLHHIAEQNSTDFEKALCRVAAPFVLGLGFLGERVDHELAAFHVLAKYAHRRVLLIGARDVICHCPPWIDLTLPVDTRLSLYPMGRVTGRSRGLVWPIDGLAFSPLTRIGTSNRASAGQQRLDMDAPGMLLILPARHWPDLLTAPCGTWDAGTQP